MKWRLQEGRGEAVYQIGVEDNGLLVGLAEEEMRASLKTLHRMAEKYASSSLSPPRVPGQPGPEGLGSGRAPLEQSLTEGQSESRQCSHFLTVPQLPIPFHLRCLFQKSCPGMDCPVVGSEVVSGALWSRARLD